MTEHDDITYHGANDACPDRDLIEWEGEGSPPALKPLRRRFRAGIRPELDVGRVWWPLLLRLDRDLSALDPT